MTGGTMSPAADAAWRLKGRVAVITEAAGAAAAARLGAPFLRADAGLKPDVEALIRRAVEIHGRVDIMLANAGILHAAEFLDFAEADFDRVIRTNLKSVFLCGQA